MDCEHVVDRADSNCGAPGHYVHNCGHLSRDSTSAEVSEKGGREEETTTNCTIG